MIKAINQQINQPVIQSISQSIKQSTNHQPTNKSFTFIDWLTDSLIKFAFGNLVVILKTRTITDTIIAKVKVAHHGHSKDYTALSTMQS